MDKRLNDAKVQKSYGKLMRNKIWILLIIILAILDIFYLYPRMHLSASAESVAIRLDKKPMKKGWVQGTENGKTYYYDKLGRQVRGAAHIDDRDYYFDSRMGYMKTGFVEADGAVRYYGEDGAMAKGAVTTDSGSYYFDENGNMHKGWLEHDGEKYYYGEDGKQLLGMHLIDGRMCMFDSQTGAYMDMSADPSRPMVALTWDDGPAASTTAILDALEAVGGHATFFVVGERVQYYEDTIKRAVSLGCEIGNHTWGHVYLDRLDAAGIAAQLTQTNDKVEQVTGVRPVIMRPTGGRVTESVKANAGMPMIYWSVDTEDWKTKNTQSTVDAILNNVKDGDIILMHDLYEATAAAAQQVIPELVNRGYQLVTVSEMAAARGKLENGVVYFNFPPQTSENQG